MAFQVAANIANRPADFMDCAVFFAHGWAISNAHRPGAIMGRPHKNIPDTNESMVSSREARGEGLPGEYCG
jgi:hypothetical protein